MISPAVGLSLEKRCVPSMKPSSLPKRSRRSLLRKHSGSVTITWKAKGGREPTKHEHLPTGPLSIATARRSG
jgi:hypothetical protein